jgi:PAS domain S-box-containing protein
MAQMRREATETLRRSEERLLMALAAARMVAWQWRPADDRSFFSETAAEVFGLPPGYPLESGQQAFALVHPDDVAGHRAVVARAVEECGSYVTQFRWIRPDNGRVIWLEDRAHAVQQEPGADVQLIGVVMDITERKQAEEALRLQVAKTTRLVESNIIGVLFADRQRITEANDAFLQMVGYSRADLQAGRLRWPEMTPAEYAAIAARTSSWRRWRTNFATRSLPCGMACNC